MLAWSGLTYQLPRTAAMPNVRPNDRPSFKLSYPFFSHAFFRLRSKSENFLRAVDRYEPPIDLNEMSVNVTSQVFKEDN